MSLLYIGAGTDPLPSMLFPQNKVLIYVDQIPGDRLGHYEANMMGAQENKTFQIYLSYLLRNFQNTGHQIGEIILDTQVKLLTVQLDLNGFQRILYYFYNTVFPEECPNELKDLLQTVDHWYLCGYVPDYQHLNHQIGFQTSSEFVILRNLKKISSSDHCLYKLPKTVKDVVLDVIDEIEVISPLSDIYRTEPEFGGLPINVENIHKYIPKRFGFRKPSRFRIPSKFSKG